MRPDFFGCSNEHACPLLAFRARSRASLSCWSENGHAGDRVSGFLGPATCPVPLSIWLESSLGVPPSLLSSSPPPQAESGSRSASAVTDRARDRERMRRTLGGP